MPTPTTGVHPGTVSKILWHFTGGPEWDESKKRQRLNPKKPILAYRALESILKTRELRLGKYREYVKVTYYVRVTDPKTKVVTREPREVQFESASVCCLADIPIAHLSYHARRYGKFAIGFHRRPVVKHRFSPVFYALNEAEPVQSLRRCFSRLESINEDADSKAMDVNMFSIDLTCKEGHPVNDDFGELSNFESAFESIGSSAKEALDQLRAFFAFAKTFGQSEFSTVYCEREWRSTKEFAFELEDVAMIVLPRQGAPSFFDEFLKREGPKLPRAIPIVPWEDLVEYQD